MGLIRSFQAIDLMVPPAGLEPARPQRQQILSLPRLPIPPRGQHSNEPERGILARDVQASTKSGEFTAAERHEARARPMMRHFPGSAMDIGNLFWIFFIFMALQPLIAARWTWTMQAKSEPGR